MAHSLPRRWAWLSRAADLVADAVWVPGRVPAQTLLRHRSCLRRYSPSVVENSAARDRATIRVFCRSGCEASPRPHVIRRQHPCRVLNGVSALSRCVSREVICAAAMVAAILAGQGAFGQTGDGTAAPAATPQAVSTSTAPMLAQGGTIKGTVKAGATPLPGVAVTATNTLTGKKYATTTDVDGVYQMQVPRNGRYVIKTELTGFASSTKEVVVNAS